VPTRLAPFQRQLRDALAADADPARAEQMRAYTKSALPCFGVPMPAVRRLAKALGKTVEFDDLAEFDRFERGLFGEATHREERYVALALLDVKATRRFQVPGALPLYEWLITTGAWWDLVDEVATHRLSPLLEADRAATVKALRRWSRGGDLWLRRAAIICQVLRGEATELPLLFELIEPALGEKEFFLRKSIGWALRAAARHHPAEVRRYVDANATRLSGLSRREAEKGLRAR
jgi:3-methyladenine DNA glycosylase AlkD